MPHTFLTAVLKVIVFCVWLLPLHNIKLHCYSCSKALILVSDVEGSPFLLDPDKAGAVESSLQHLAIAQDEVHCVVPVSEPVRCREPVRKPSQ